MIFVGLGKDGGKRIPFRDDAGSNSLTDSAIPIKLIT